MFQLFCRPDNVKQVPPPLTFFVKFAGPFHLLLWVKAVNLRTSIGSWDSCASSGDRQTKLQQGFRTLHIEVQTKDE